MQNKKNDKLTDKSYWESEYENRSQLQPINVNRYKNLCVSKIFDIKKSIGLEGKDVLEIGGAGSPWIPFLAQKYPSSTFVAIDYSEVGCQQLLNYTYDNGITNIKVICSDFFDFEPKCERYDFVYSHGVVEHFSNASKVLNKFSSFLNSSGVMLTIIPNMAGLNGLLSRWLNKEIYEVHISHDRNSMVKSHYEGNLEVLAADYLCSTNFKVLSSCIKKNSGVKWEVYKYLTRVSKLVWTFENLFFDLPVSKLFSPYIYIISKRKV